jgi:hypothetical protein
MADQPSAETPVVFRRRSNSLRGAARARSAVLTQAEVALLVPAAVQREEEAAGPRGFVRSMAKFYSDLFPVTQVTASSSSGHMKESRELRRPLSSCDPRPQENSSSYQEEGQQQVQGDYILI